MIAISIAITTCALFITMGMIYAVYTWAEVKAKEEELRLKEDEHTWGTRVENEGEHEGSKEQ